MRLKKEAIKLECTPVLTSTLITRLYNVYTLKKIIEKKMRKKMTRLKEQNPFSKKKNMKPKLNLRLQAFR